MSSGGGGNPIKQAKSAVSGAIDPIASAVDRTTHAITSRDPTGLTGKGSEALGDAARSIRTDPKNLLVANPIGLAYLTASRARQDMRDQAAGQAQADINRAAAAEQDAANRAPKALDPLALERRRRASVTSVNGRAATILTGGTALGSSDAARKTLLGL